MDRLTPRQKAAQIIISLGTDAASSIYKHLQEDEVEKLTYEITRQQSVPPEVADSVIEEFYGLCVAQKVYLEGGVVYAKNVLEKAFGVQQATALLERVTKSLRTKAFGFIRKADYKNLMNMIINEHPQTIALILSYARADQASAIIAELPKDVQVEVVERIAKMDRTSPEIRQVSPSGKFESCWRWIFWRWEASITSPKSEQNRQEHGKFIFDELGKRMRLAEEIGSACSYSDIVTWIPSPQKFLREVDTRDLAIALKGANKRFQSYSEYNPNVWRRGQRRINACIMSG